MGGTVALRSVNKIFSGELRINQFEIQMLVSNNLSKNYDTNPNPPQYNNSGKEFTTYERH